MKKYSKNKTYFNNHGFCIINSFLTRRELNQLNNKVKNFIKNKSKDLKGRNINLTKNKNQILCMISINSINISKDLLWKKNTNYKVHLKSNPEFRKCEIFAKPAQTGMASPFHQIIIYGQ